MSDDAPHDYMPWDAYDDGRTQHYDLYIESQQLRRDLNDYVRQLRESGSEYAASDREYHVLKRVRTLELRDEGMPVTLVTQVVKGIDDVAKAREKMLVAEAMHRANLEAIQSCKLQLRLIEAQIQREMSNPQAGF